MGSVHFKARELMMANKALFEVKKYPKKFKFSGNGKRKENL